MAETDSTSDGAGGWRRWVPWVLVALAALVLLVGSLTVWVKRQALSTDAWANASEQIIQDPETRAAVSSYLVEQTFANRDVATQVQQALPPRLAPLAPALSAALSDVSQRLAEQLLARPAVQDLWVEANREAHRTFLDVVDEREGLVSSEGDRVVLDLRPLLERLAERVGVSDRLQPDAGLVEVATAAELTQVKRGVRAVRVLSQLLMLAAIVLVAAAVWIAAGRRRAVVMGVGAAMVLVGLIDLVMRRVVGNYIVDTLADATANQPVVENGWLVGTSLMRDVAFALISYGLLVIATGWLAGMSHRAVAARRWVAPKLRAHPWPAAGVAAAVALVVLVWGPGGGDRQLLGTLVLCALFATAVAILWRQSLREFPASREAGALPY